MGRSLQSHPGCLSESAVSTVSEPRCWATRGSPVGSPRMEIRGDIESDLRSYGTPLGTQMQLSQQALAGRAWCRPPSTTGSWGGPPGRTEDLHRAVMWVKDLLSLSCHHQVKETLPLWGGLERMGKWGRKAARRKYLGDLKFLDWVTFNFLSLHSKVKQSGGRLDRL